MQGPRPKLFSFQSSLPPLPVPDLDATCARLLRSVRALATDAEYAVTEKRVADFLREGGDGRKLHQMLVDHAEREWKQGRSWLETMWFEWAYLKWPDPLPLHSNVFFYFITIPSRDVDHIKQAARVLSCFLSAKGMIEREELPVEMLGAKPLDMSQHTRAFTTAREPGANGDKLHVLRPSHEVVVVCNHRFYAMAGEDAQGNLVCAKVLERQLRDVWRQAHSGPRPELSVGLMTTQERPVWAAVRAELLPLNRQVLERIDKALVLIVLEDYEPTSSDDAISHIAAGDASNRWFDKGSQLVVFRNGLSGMNCEHSPAEATMHEAVWGDPLFRRMRDLGPWAYPDVYREPEPPVEPPQELIFKPTPTLNAALETALKRYQADWDDVEFHAYLFDEWGGEWARSQGLPIDSVVQMALQLAWGLFHGDPGVPTYETAHLRLFKHSRTETTRSCSVESVAWVKSHLAGAPLAEQQQLLRAALEAQKDYMLAAMRGKGCDRHLLALRVFAAGNGLQPELFQDPMFARSSHWQLSTSTVRTTEVGGFAPIVVDGYGICYMVWKSGSSIGACITSRRSSPNGTSAAGFAAALSDAFRIIRRTFEAVSKM